MKKKFLIPALSVLLFIYGCVKETYDMDKVSTRAHLSPTMFVPVFKGTATFGDIVKENDTIVYDEDKSVKIILRQDSVIDLSLNDFYDLNNLVAFSKDYELGELKIDPFEGSLDLSLNQLIQSLPVILKNQITALDDGGLHPFPELPAINLTALPFTQFNNILEAHFSSGYIDISVTNNLNTPLNSFQIVLSNTYGQIGSPIIISSAAPGETKTASVNLAGAILTNTLMATISLSGSPGNDTPVRISLENNKIGFSVKGRDLRISSGTVILPQQEITTGAASDEVVFTPQQAMEIERMAITTGDLSWGISTSIPLRASASLLLSGIERNEIPVSTTISVSSAGQGSGTISLANTVLNLDSDITHPYNKFPFEYTFTVSSDNTLVTVSSTDVIQLDLGLSEPSFDYIKGYFGQEIETFSEARDLEIEDVVKNITGEFHIADPRVKLHYSNSFAVPIDIMMDIEGIKGDESVNLGLDPVSIKYPDAPLSRDKTDFFAIDKTNSQLPDFVSLPPEQVVLTGTAKMNPAGDPDHLRNNYIFGNSRFLGSLEIEVPLEVGFNNLHFRDTTDNFITGEDMDIKPEDASMVALDIKAENGFPFGVSFAVRLYDPVARTVINSLVVNDFLTAAPVDASGRVNGVTQKETRIEFTEDFLDDISRADQIILDFGISTTNTADVKIYSDYKIDFSVVLGVNADVNIDF